MVLLFADWLPAMRTGDGAGGRDGHGACGRAVQDVGQGLRGVDGRYQPQQEGACMLLLLCISVCACYILSVCIFVRVRA